MYISNSNWMSTYVSSLGTPLIRPDVLIPLVFMYLENMFVIVKIICKFPKIRAVSPEIF